MTIIRGTTPTIEYRFKEIDPADIAAAYLIIMQRDSVVIEKNINDAAVTEDLLYFDLSQADTLKLQKCRGVMILDWKTNNGKRGRANIREFDVEDSGKNEEI